MHETRIFDRSDASRPSSQSESLSVESRVSQSPRSSMPTAAQRARRDSIIVQGAALRLGKNAVQALLRLAGFTLQDRRVQSIARDNGFPFENPRDEGRPSQAVVDQLVSAFVTSHSSAYGYREIYDYLRTHLPRITRRSVQRALVRHDPAAAAMRSADIFRRMTRNGHFYAPHFGALWQSDLNLMLARYGLGLAAVYDMKSRTLICLNPIDSLMSCMATISPGMVR